MKTCLECVRCFSDHALHLAEKLEMGYELREKVMKDTLRAVAEFDFAKPPPLVARQISGIVTKHSGIKDPYLKEKDASTEYARKVFEMVRDEFEKFPDRFEALVRLAIAGNIIDFGVDCNFKLESARDKIINSFQETIDKRALAVLRSKLESAGHVLYIMDNCGEAVFDKMLIEQYKEKITLAVRGRAILNDITRRELASSGLENLARRTVDTGDGTPGVCLEDSSDEFRDAFEKADLIIAKGQGNFETLSETTRPTVFLFRAKCAVVIKHIGGGVPMGSFQIRPVNI